ncbi:hypothetical protein [Burkholderia gladioli]|uniref:hypothetical protein n=1 Tax=Burkholderia gladioli TaxID=28095 RepID=UPI0010575F19|nr:hypothetical protein [Burkholderia gladioli]
MTEFDHIDVTAMHIVRSVGSAVTTFIFADVLKTVQDVAREHGYVFIRCGRHDALPHALMTSMRESLSRQLRARLFTDCGDRTCRALLTDVLLALEEQGIGLVIDPHVIASETLARARQLASASTGESMPGGETAARAPTIGMQASPSQTNRARGLLELPPGVQRRLRTLAVVSAFIAGGVFAFVMLPTGWRLAEQLFSFGDRIAAHLLPADATDKPVPLAVTTPPGILNEPVLRRPQPHLMRQRKGVPQSINGEDQQ